MGWIRPSRSRTEPPPPAAARVPASRDHGTAAAALQIPSLCRIPGEWGLGARRFQTAAAALREGDDAPAPSHLVLSFAEFLDPGARS